MAGGALADEVVAHQHENLYTYGRGFDFYRSPEEERAAVESEKWHPGTVDLAATGKTAGSAYGVSSMGELTTLLLHQVDGSIRNLYIVGHSSRNSLALTGTLIENGTDIDFGNTIDVPAVENMDERDKELISRKFAAESRIILVGCNSTEQPESLQEPLSREWSHPGRRRAICVVGFPSTVWWCIQFSSTGAVVSRGRVATDPPKDAKSCKQYKVLRDLKVSGC